MGRHPGVRGFGITHLGQAAPESIILSGVEAVPLEPGAGLDPRARVGAVHLTVVDVDRVASFYERVIGLEPLRREEARAVLGAGDRELLVLVGEPGAQPAPGRPGLFHTAFLVPSRRELARSLRRIALASVPLTGLSEHLVSEAIYLDDPEGNGIEVYRDRPREEWTFDDGHIRMTTEPMDVHGVLAAGAGEAEPPERVAAETTVGHVHLRVADVAAAERWWREVVGLDVMARYGPSASFLAVGGYHHQLGMNSWGSLGAEPPPPGAAGLREFELLVPELPNLDDGEPLDGGFALRDPSGNRVVLRR
jgi:catechol 2,3-dioxygenase